MSAASYETPRYRVPKLAVRNRVSETSSSDSYKIQSSHYPEHADASHTRAELAEAAVHPALRNSSTISCGQPGQAVLKQEKTGTRSSGKRRSGGVLGFLTLKEPSTSALEEFAESEKRRIAAQKGSKMISGVSTQKLPSNVPKVNSKWNGLPEPTQRKSAAAEQSSPRHSQVSLASRHSGNSDGSQTRSSRPRLGSTTGTSHFRRSNERLCNGLASSSRNVSNSPPTTPPELVQSVISTTLEDSPQTPSSDTVVARRGYVPALNLEYNEQKKSVAQRSEPCVPDAPLTTSRHNTLSGPVPTVHSLDTCLTNKADEVLPWEAYEPIERSAILKAQPNAPVPEGKKSRSLSKKLGFK